MLLLVVVAPLPWRLKRRVLVALGAEIAPTASVGLSLVDARRLVLGPGARIGHLTLVLRLKHLELGKDAHLGSLNLLTGPRDVAVADRVVTADWPSRMVLEEGAIVFNRHFFDVSGDVELGAGTILAGAFSRVWSHGPHAMEDGQRGLHPETVRIGARSYVGAGSTLLPGVVLPEGATVGAASVVTRSVNALEPGARVAGNPARPV